MRLKTKKAVLAYLEAHNDGSDDAKDLIRSMKNECGYADCDAYSICPDDLGNLSDDAQEILREHFGKSAGDEWTVDECEEVADRLADWICDEFGENLNSTVEYQF